LLGFSKDLSFLIAYKEASISSARCAPLLLTDSTRIVSFGTLICISTYGKQKKGAAVSRRAFLYFRSPALLRRPLGGLALRGFLGGDGGGFAEGLAGSGVTASFFFLAGIVAARGHGVILLWL